MLGRLDLQGWDPGERDTNRGSITGEGRQESAASRVELLADECQGEFVLNEMKLDDVPRLGLLSRLRERKDRRRYIYRRSKWKPELARCHWGDMIIETAVSLPYQMAPLLSGNRGAVTPILTLVGWRLPSACVLSLVLNLAFLLFLHDMVAGRLPERQG
jgi:hypothetical protein